MIKLCNGIYIHFLTVILFFSAYITRTLEITIAMYSVMLIHELAHFVSAKVLGLKISKLIFYPFGVSLRLNSIILLSFSEEIILYLSGPLVNAVIAVIFALNGKFGVLYINNLALFLLNILPIIPLDGGRILETIISRYKGRKNAKKILKFIGILIYSFLIYLLLKSKTLNINTLTLILFLLGSIIFEKEKYSVDLIKELTFSNLNKRRKAELFVFSESEPIRNIIKEFNPSKNSLVAFIDDKERIVSLKTDREIIKSLLNY